ncbi:MAG: hypothetical protein C4346_12485 [Chloroflexota bacterium]
MIAGIPDQLDVREAALPRSLPAMPARNELAVDELQVIAGIIEMASGPRVVRFPYFSVKMKTGTSKIPVYLRTAFAPFRR